MTNSVFALFGIVLGMTILSLPHDSSATSKDGFNIYKDFLRGKGDEDEDMAELIEDPRNGKVSYFYRTPAQIGLRSQTSTDLGKRTLNRFKNYMLSKETQAEEMLHKRGGGSFLGWALANQQNTDHE